MTPPEWSELTEVRKKNSGESRERGLGARSPLFIFRPNNWGLKSSLSPLSQGLDDRRLAPTLSTSPYLKVWICHWRVRVVEAALWIKSLKVFFRLKQLNSLSGKKIPHHFWDLIDVNCFKLITVSKWDNVFTLWLSNLICCFSQTGKGIYIQNFLSFPLNTSWEPWTSKHYPQCHKGLTRQLKRVFLTTYLETAVLPWSDVVSFFFLIPNIKFWS